MRLETLSWAVATVTLATLLSGFASSEDEPPTNTETPAAEPAPPSDRTIAESDGETQEPATTSRDAPTDPVPEAIDRMKPWPGLSDAVTEVVMSSPKGRIHGHDAERIEITVDDSEGTAELRFVMPASFALHGHRTISCLRTGAIWSCRDTS